MSRRKRKYPGNSWHPFYWPTWLVIGVMRIAARLPLAWQVAIGRGIASLFYPFLWDRRHIAEVNLKLCFPELELHERKRLLHQTIEENMVGFFETASAWWRNPEYYRNKIAVSGIEHLLEAQRNGDGVLLIGSHYTSLDLGGTILSLFADMDVMYRKHRNPLFERVMTRSRERRFGMAIERKDIRTVIRQLKAGRTVWYAPDQDYGRKHSVFAPFFGVPAATITATSRLARMGKCKVIIFSHHRNKDDSGYVVRFSAPLENYPTNDPVADATRINQLIEAEIRLSPAHYMWVHRRFKTRPEGEPRPY